MARLRLPGQVRVPARPLPPDLGPGLTAKFIAASALAVTFSDHVTLGSALVVLVLGIYGVVNIIAGGRRWKDEYEAKKIECDRESKRANDAEANLLKMEMRVQQLEERPNMEQILYTMGELAVKEDAEAALRTERGVESVERTVREEFQNHERRAQERHDETVAVLRQIADSLKEAA